MPLVGHHDFFLYAGGGIAIRGRAIGLQRKHHALLDLRRMIEGDHPRDDGPLMQGKAEAMPELQPERRHLVGEPEILRLRPDLADLVGGDPRLDQRDRLVQPFARLLVGVVLDGSSAAHIEGAVVARAVPHEGLQDIEERLVPRSQHAVGEIVRMRIAALPGDGIDRLHVIGAVPIEELVDLADDVVLAHPRLELLIDELIGAGHHGGGAVEKRDLVDVLDLARLQQDLLAIGDLEPGLLQLEQHRRLDDVYADRHLVHPRLLEQRGDLLGVALHQPEGGIDRAAQPDEPRLAVLRQEPGGVELVMHRGRAEVPQDRLAVAGKQRPAAELVALPFPDLGRGDVADVVDVEDEECAELGAFQRLAHAREAIAVEPPVIDALLEIDPHDAERRQRARPVVARVDVVGADLAHGLVHSVLLIIVLYFSGRLCGAGSGRDLYSKLLKLREVLMPSRAPGPARPRRPAPPATDLPRARPQLPAERAGPRVALLIGISSYPEADAPLIAPKNDARVLADELKRIGFEVEVAEDLPKGGFHWAIENFKKTIEPGSTALFFFSGYGLQANRQTYLIPADAEIWREADVAREGANLETVLADMNSQGAAVKLAIIDASRRNPFERRFRSVAAGLAPINVAKDSLVIYSAGPGEALTETAGEQSLFMNELLKELRAPGISAEEVFARTRIGVSRASDVDQVPWVASSLVESFYFVPSGRSSADRLGPRRNAAKVSRAGPPQ